MHACVHNSRRVAFLLLVRVTVDGTYPCPCMHAVHDSLLWAGMRMSGCMTVALALVITLLMAREGTQRTRLFMTLIPGVHARINIVSRPLAQLAWATGTAAAALLAVVVWLSMHIMLINHMH